MRKIDEPKSALYEKAAKTISFDKIVLIKLEERCKQLGTNPSKYVNKIIRNIVFDDAEFYREQAKFHLAEFHKAQYMIQELEAKKEIKS